MSPPKDRVIDPIDATFDAVAEKIVEGAPPKNKKDNRIGDKKPTDGASPKQLILDIGVEIQRDVDGTLCHERCAQRGEMPCNQVSAAYRPCDECDGMAMAVMQLSPRSELLEALKKLVDASPMGLNSVLHQPLIEAIANAAAVIAKAEGGMA